MSRCPTLLLCSLLAALSAPMAPAQTAAPLPPLRVEVDRDGLFRIPVSMLEKHWDIHVVPADRIGMFLEDQPVPIDSTGLSDGRLDPGDGVVFYGQARTSPHSQTNVYELRITRNPLRIPRAAAASSSRDTLDEALREVTFEENRVFVPLETVHRRLLSAPRDDPWFWASITAPRRAGVPDAESSATILAEIHPEPRRSIGAELEIQLEAPPVEVAQQISVNLNGKDLPPVSFRGTGVQVLRVPLPAGLLERKNTLQIRNESKINVVTEPDNEMSRGEPNRLWIDHVTFRFPTLLLGPSRNTEQASYRLSLLESDRGRALQWSRMTQDPMVVFDVSHRRFLSSGPFQLSASGQGHIICAGVDSHFEPKAVAPFARTDAHLPGPGADWIAITTSRLAPALGPLVEHRKSQGFDTCVVEARALYDTFSHGQFDPSAITRFVMTAHGAWKKKPRYLLLVGDADRSCDWISVHETLPTHMVMTAYNGETATDAPFADVDGNGMADLAVGRLPIRSETELTEYISRLVTYETKPPSGDWRRRVEMVAGQGGFGPMVDGLIESTFRRVVARDIPPRYQVGLTWTNPTSPWYWPAPSFSSNVIDRYNAGSLVFAYFGHGSRRAFDRVADARGRPHPIFETESIERLSPEHRSPFMAIVACWTGAFDEPAEDCIGELLLRSPQGPVAVLASSRVSHPLPNALFGIGLCGAFFEGDPTIGEMVDATRVQMLRESKGPMGALARPFLSKAVDSDALVRDHLYLYNLFGDPATRVARPTDDFTPLVADQILPGKEVVISVPVGTRRGKVTVTLERPVGTLPPYLPTQREGFPLDADAMATHKAANNLVVAQATATAAGEGNLQVTVPMPGSLTSGTYHVVAYLAADDGPDACGSARVVIEP